VWRLGCWAEARLKIARMTLTIKLDGNWSSFQLANSAPPLSVTDSALAPSARIQDGTRLFTEILESLYRAMLPDHPNNNGFNQIGSWLQFCTMRARAKVTFQSLQPFVGSRSQANYLLRNSAMDDSIGGS